MFKKSITELDRVEQVNAYFLVLTIFIILVVIPACFIIGTWPLVEEIQEDEEPAIPEPLIEEAIEETEEETPGQTVLTLDNHIEAEAARFGVSLWLAREIMRCESSHYGGAVNYNRRPDGTIWSTDVGMWQINNYYHEATATSMGLDIYNEYDNVTYGFWLLANEGTHHWKASAYCWT
jgi:hypothetical protein